MEYVDGICLEISIFKYNIVTPSIDWVLFSYFQCGTVEPV